MFESRSDFQTHAKKIDRMIHQFSQELASIQNSVPVAKRSRRAELLEVMCAHNSELTKQLNNQGGYAVRHDSNQGDLSTIEGRKVLFTNMVMLRPKNIWYSPTCGPWSQWSHKIVAQRENQLWQAALGVVMFRHQRRCQSHFHMEQPSGSTQRRLPRMSEIVQHSKWTVFDLCRVGNLRDPVTNEYLRKRLTVSTTSLNMHKMLNNRLCEGNHHHQQIAGSTVYQNERMNVSKYTELYPRKFARQISRIIKDDLSSPILGADSQSNDGDHPTKRRRLNEKMSPQAIAHRLSFRHRNQLPGLKVTSSRQCHSSMRQNRQLQHGRR